ncbi:MAG: hypothetical protein WCH31_05990 [Actinomycetes bacterium]
MVLRYRRAVGPLATGALVAALYAFAPLAQARSADSLTLEVTFFTTGNITLTMNSTPIGTTTGAATVIPAGYYELLMWGPGGCTALPRFRMNGPGENVVDNMTEGEVANESYNAYFLPNSTYTWTNDAFPGVVHTFKTTSDIQGTAPVVSATGYASRAHGTATSTDFVGSKKVPFRGTLAGAVSTSGKLSLAFHGKAVTSLMKGRYTFAITDASMTSGFMISKDKQSTAAITAKAFRGKRAVTLNLTKGRWFFSPAVLGKKTYVIDVN